MASSGGSWVPVTQSILKQALSAGSRVGSLVRAQISAASRLKLQSIKVRSTPSYTYNGIAHQPVHPLAFRRQLKSRSTRWHSTFASTSTSSTANGFRAAVRRFFGTSRAAAANASRHVDRTAFLKTPIGSQAVWGAAGRAPFASTLRPSLTGGALPRTAGGYAAGAAGRGGARFFSHTPAAPAQVVQNVSQAMRAFWLSGQRARFDGTDAHGRPCYRTVSAVEEEAARKLAVPKLPSLAPGAYVDFALKPTITALAGVTAAAPLETSFGATVAAKDTKNNNYCTIQTAPSSLGTEGFLDVLSVDFSRALKELTAIMGDLKRLAALGDLPVLLESGSVLRVRFPGVDADTVDRLCEDLGITRGIVGQDAEFDAAAGTATALRFPFAPEAVTPTGTAPAGSVRSHDSDLSSLVDAGIYDGYDFLDKNNPWLLSQSSEYNSMSPPVAVSSAEKGALSECSGLEGVYRFLEACDQAQGRC